MEYYETAAYVKFGNFVIVRDLSRLENYLNALKTTPVVKFDKTEGFAVSYRSHPTAYNDLLICIFFSVFIKFAH